MKKTNKIKLVEASYLLSNNNNSDVIEDLNTAQQPNFTILDVTVIPDEEYNPTIQSILIDLEESQELHKSQSDKLSINILSEMVNSKTGYSMSLFEFESSNKVVTLSLTLTESDKYKGVWNVSAYTTKGEKVFETNTQTPRVAISKYLNSLSNEYLLEADEMDGYGEFNGYGDDVETLVKNKMNELKKKYPNDIYDTSTLVGQAYEDLGEIYCDDSDEAMEEYNSILARLNGGDK